VRAVLRRAHPFGGTLKNSLVHRAYYKLTVS
jgi:hypothetical protein